MYYNNYGERFVNNSIICGGEGDDSISLGISSNNSLIFTTGDGNDTVTFTAGTNAYTHTIKFTDVAFEDLSFEVNVLGQSNLVIKYGEDDSVTLSGWFSCASDQRINKIIDKNGDEYSIREEITGYTMFGLDERNSYTISRSDAIFTSDDRVDSITLSGGRNTINTKGGNDTLTVTGGTNTIYTEDGNDSVTIQTSNNIIDMGDGNDTFTITKVSSDANYTCTNNKIYGGAGNDNINLYYELNYGGMKYRYLNSGIVSGDEGNDTITLGNTNNNTIVFSEGDGKDIIYWNAGANAFTHTLQFTDVKFEDLEFAVNPNAQANLLIMYGEGDYVQLSNWFGCNSDQRIDKIVDKDGEEFSIRDNVTRYSMYGDGETTTFTLSRGSTNYTASDRAETITISGGNDIVRAEGGNDRLYFNSSNNTIYMGDGNDTISHNVNNGSYSNNTIYGGNGNDTIYMYNTSNTNGSMNSSFVYGNEGNDTIALLGSQKNTMYFTSGDGKDTITFTAGTNAYTHVMEFTDVKFEDMSFSIDKSNTNSLKIHYTNDDCVTITNWFNQAYYNRLDKIVDSEGSEISLYENLTNYQHIYYDSTDEIITVPINGVNIYTSSADNVILMASKNNDIIHFATGGGDDNIVWDNNSNAPTNKLQFDNAKISDMSFSIDPLSSNNLLITYGDGDTVSLNNWFSYGNKISQIIDADGVETALANAISTSVSNGITASIAENKLVFDFFTDDTDTLTISDALGSEMYITANFNADGTIDGNGVRVIDVSRYEDWTADVGSVNGGVQIVSELGSVENIKSMDNAKNITAADLDSLKADVMAWFTANTDYSDVARAIANSANDSSVSSLVAIYDNFNGYTRGIDIALGG